MSPIDRLSPLHDRSTRVSQVERPFSRRRLIRAALGTAVSAGVGLLAACGAASTGTGVGADPPGRPDGKPRLNTGATLFFMNSMGGPYAGVMEEWATSFRDRTGVKVETSPGTQDFANKLDSSFASGTPPDIFIYHQERVPIVTAVERKMLLRIDSYVKRDHYDLADFRKDAIELNRWKGGLYALPRDYGLQLLFYNVDHFRRAGIKPPPASWQDRAWTFAALLDAAKQLTVRSGGETTQWALRVNRAWRPWASFVYSNGGAVVNRSADGLATGFALHEPAAVEALQFVQDLMYRHHVAPTPDEEKAIGGWQPEFQAGRLSMFITNPGVNNWFRPNAGVPYDVGVFPLGPSGRRRGVGGGGTGWGAAAPTKHPEEAWAFMAHITSPEGQLVEVKVGQTTPSRTSVVTGPEYLDPSQPPEHKRAFADGQDYVVRDPVAVQWPDAQRDVLNAALNERFWSGKETAAQVANTIREQGSSYFKS